MHQRENPYLRRQQARALRCDAHRWIRPDAAKFLKPGADAADIYPALAQRRDRLRQKHDRAIDDAIACERSVLAALRAELDEIKADFAGRRHLRAEQKYSPNQPRVPAGNGRESGRWSDGSYGNGDRPRVVIDTTNLDNGDAGDGSGDASGFSLALPMGGIDFGDLGSATGSLGRLFEITPRPRRRGGVRLAGDPPQRLPPIFVTPDPLEPGDPGLPGIGDTGGPPLEPPEIPRRLPETREERMDYVRAAARWFGLVGRYSPIAIAYFGFLNELDYLKIQTDMIKTANDPAETYEVLRERATQPSQDGYQDHHVVNQHDANRRKFGDSRIDDPNNRVRLPKLKHIEISRWYQTGNKSKKYGGRSPADYLRDKDWEEQFQVGLEVLRDFKVIK